MRPQDNTNSQKATPARDISIPARDAAINVVRGQLDALYSQKDASTPVGTPTAPAATPQAVTQPTPVKAAEPVAPAASSSKEAWAQYHNAWQEYYQKYYQHYYTGHAHRIITEERQKNSGANQSLPVQPAPHIANQAAVDELRSKIQDKVKSNAQKVRKSRHFIPISAAALVLVIFVFLQYNSVLIGTVQAYVSPGTIDPQNIVVDPTANAQIGPDPRLIIPKINVDVPVMYGISNKHDSQMAAMEKGVAHFAIPGANSVPGQIGNTVISGHSSNDLFEPGDYKFVFAQLEKLQEGDTIYANYESVRYTYTITKKEIVKPSEVSKLTYPTEQPVLTLITCWPLGTADKRLLVTAEQVSPDPTKAVPTSATGTGDSSMPGNGPSAFEKIFGAR